MAALNAGFSPWPPPRAAETNTLTSTTVDSALRPAAATAAVGPCRPWPAASSELTRLLDRWPLGLPPPKASDLTSPVVLNEFGGFDLSVMIRPSPVGDRHRRRAHGRVDVAGRRDDQLVRRASEALTAAVPLLAQDGGIPDATRRRLMLAAAEVARLLAELS